MFQQCDFLLYLIIENKNKNAFAQTVRSIFISVLKVIPLTEWGQLPSLSDHIFTDEAVNEHLILVIYSFRLND